MANEFRPEVVTFAQLMEARLRDNDHKPGWKKDPPGLLFARLLDETAELMRRIEEDEGSIGDELLIGLEAADVANFAMMIADVCGALE